MGRWNYKVPIPVDSAPLTRAWRRDLSPKGRGKRAG